MNQLLITEKASFDGIIERLRGELATIRTGRASVGLVDMVKVEAYGSLQDLKNLASIIVTDTKTVQIEPWDANIVKDIEKGIELSGIGIHPVVAGKIIRLTMPQMTEDTRKQLTKTVGKKAEEANVFLRQTRDEIKKKIEKSETANEIAEDARYRLQEELDELTKEYKDKIVAIEKEKCDQIMEV
ncbi:MAG: ribosome recycling factor [Patescibacteria group bacterium]